MVEKRPLSPPRRSRRTSLVATVRLAWIALCLWVLVYAWLNRDIPGTDESVARALIILTFPVALTLSVHGFGVFFLLERLTGVTVAGGFGFNAVFWLLSVALGYWFWFVLVPRLSHPSHLSRRPGT